MLTPGEYGFVTQTFRDVGDQDYIAARTLYRVGLDLQFLWAGLQAIEKYLKGILLFNGLSARGLGHDLCRAFDRVLSISDIPFDFPGNMRDCLEIFEAFGANRYLQRPYDTHGDELLSLDRTVWHLRRYCQYLRTEVAHADGTRVSILKAELAHLQATRLLQNPRRFAILNGYLEGVLKSDKSPLRQNLIWCNEYFGSPRGRPSSAFAARSRSVIPRHFDDPTLFDVLRSKVDFPKQVVQYFENLQPNTYQPAPRQERRASPSSRRVKKTHDRKQ